MVRELEVNEEKKTIHISVRQGFYGGLLDTTLELIDLRRTAKELCGVFAFEDAITGAQISALSKEIESLRRRVLSPDEIHRLVHILRAKLSEVSLRAQPTSDDLLVEKLEAMGKN